MFLYIWRLFSKAATDFISDDAFTHGAAMAFYATTSLAPVLLIVVAVAGLAYGDDAARIAISAQVSGLMGAQSAELLQATLEGASKRSSGTLATIVGLVTLVVTASGVFGEMQQSLNKIWKVEALPVSVSGLVRVRVASLGLVAALGFLLLVSLAASAAISALSDYINAYLPLGTGLLSTINAFVSFSLLTHGI